MIAGEPKADFFAKQINLDCRGDDARSSADRGGYLPTVTRACHVLPTSNMTLYHLTPSTESCSL